MILFIDNFQMLKKHKSMIKSFYIIQSFGITRFKGTTHFHKNCNKQFLLLNKGFTKYI